jgi:hypothetical protein
MEVLNFPSCQYLTKNWLHPYLKAELAELLLCCEVKAVLC